MCTITVEPGDFVLFCTDGITDAFNTEDVRDRARPGIRETESYAAPAELLGRIFAALGTYTRHCEQHDDMTAAVFQYEGGELQ